ncbi:MAG TPA: TRAP transporter large permease subunit, partial [Oligoflexia bacterium]|nr:TRAP transporter large permease subunit [Oligoflexia bacterium]
ANGGGAAIEETLAALHFGPAATLSLILVCGFLAGFFLDWISVLLIFIPVFVPILSRMGLDRLWICILFMLVVQTSYLTPPMAPAIFYFRGIKPDSITTGHIMRGVVPFIVIQFLLIILIFIMPELALWLPRALE